MSSYSGIHAELYDVFYGDKPYQDEAAFIHHCLVRYGDGSVRRLLELACGTGTHALELEKHGYEIVATDYTEDMLACARHKAARVKSKINFQRKDMRTLDYSPQSFDATVCLFNAIGYVTTNDELAQVFRGVHQQLRLGGLFVFDFWHAGAMLRSYDPIRVRRWTVPEGEILRISETRLECARQLGHVTYTVCVLRNDGTYTRITETQANRFFLVQEMAGILSYHGFQPIQWFAGYRDDEEITEQTWHVLAIAQRK